MDIHVGRIADDQVVRAVDGLETVGGEDVDPVPDAVLGCVEARDLDRVGRDVDSIHLHMRQVHRAGDGDAAAAAESLPR